MKFFLIFWICVQSPGILLKDTCLSEIRYKPMYENLEQCKQAAIDLADYVMRTPDVYLTTFCTSKELQLI